MDEFLTVEMGNHYINKINELMDDISGIKNDLGVATEIAELNWAGEAGQATLNVINKFDQKFSDINGSLSEAANLVSGFVEEEE